MKDIKEFFSKSESLSYFLSLTVFCYFFFFYNLDNFNHTIKLFCAIVTTIIVSVVYFLTKKISKSNVFSFIVSIILSSFVGSLYLVHQGICILTPQKTNSIFYLTFLFPWIIFLFTEFIKFGKKIIKKEETTKLEIVSFIFIITGLISTIFYQNFAYLVLIPTSFLIGKSFFEFIEKDLNKKYIIFSGFLTLILFLITGLIGGYLYLTDKIFTGFSISILFIFFSIWGMASIIKNWKIMFFGSIMATSFVLFVSSINELKLFILISKIINNG